MTISFGGSDTNNAISDGMLVRRYGAGSCPLCGGFHETDLTMVESGGSKAFVELLFQHMLLAYADLSNTQKGKAKCMIGALVPSGAGKVLIACSGDGTRPAFEAAAQMMASCVVCGPVVQPVKSIGGRTISSHQLAGWQVDNTPLQCAAPKLIMEARARGYKKPWDMSEIWFDPKMDASHFKKRTAGYTKHGWSIESCKTCANVVPALMCDQT